jgi:precorrin-6x reductase
MQGPFSTALNCALIDTFNIDCIISKCSGKSGGFYEKLEAAKIKQIDLVLISSS